MHTTTPRTGQRRLGAVAAATTLLASLLMTAAAAINRPLASDAFGAHPLAEPGEGTSHLLVSEVMTGSASASDEFIEIYNPGPTALPLEGLEVVYVTASGATITRKAAWAAGEPALEAGAHLLIANEAGIFAPVADALYANGLAATGGSVAIRIQGAATAVDAAGWGTAASTWLEATAAPAAPAGSSLERLPGGALGSGQDTNDNAVDFAVRAIPDPQNTASPPIVLATPTASPSGAQPTPTASVTSTPTPASTASASPTPTPTPATTPTPVATPSPSPVPVLSVAEARALPDGTAVVVEAVSLTDGLFTEGGGYVADETGGIAVLVADGTFPRGSLVRVAGSVDDRFHQRTIRADAANVQVLGAHEEPDAQAAATGAVGESVEGRLVSISGAVVGAPAELSGGLAFELDDGSGAARVIVAATTGLDTGSWEPGVALAVRGVVGQRDSSGSGTAGYRLQPRDPQDVQIVAATPTPSAQPTPPDDGETPEPTPPVDPSVVSIAAARAAPTGARLSVSGVVTLPSGLSEPGSAVIVDSSAAILVRLGDEAGALHRGQLVRVDGTRSTWSGMISLRVSQAPMVLGTQAEPPAVRRTTGGVGEADEATLVVARGLVTAAPRRTSAQNTYLDIDDGTGPLRVFIGPSSGVGPEALEEGAWIEVTGVVTQETSGRQPERGYRLWPRAAADVRVVAEPTGGAAAPASGGGGRGPTNAGPGIGAGAPTGGRPSAPVHPSVPPPRLALAMPTASAVREPLPVEPGADRHPVPPPREGAAALLVTAALALLAAAWLAATPDLPLRLRDALLHPAGESSRDEEPVAPSATGAATLDRTGLVALTVLDGYGGGEAPPGGRPPASRG